MKSIKVNSHFWIVMACVLPLLLAGCSRQAKKQKYLERANAQFVAGHYDRAEIEYLNVLRLDPTNHLAIRNLGLMAFEQGRLVRALELLSGSKQLNPDDYEARLKLGLTLMSLGGAKQAHEEAMYLAERQATNTDVFQLLVDSCLTTNELTEAELLLDTRKDRDAASFQIANGTLLLKRGDVTNAEASFRRALSAAPNLSASHAAMAALYALRNDLTNAEIEFKAAADLSPSRSPHRMRYVDFKIARGDLALAREILEETAKKTPDYLPALMRLAQIALAERSFAECEGGLNAILRRDPVSLEAMLLKARLRMAQDQPEQALAELERILKFKFYERVPQVFYQMALVHVAQGDMANAVRRLRQVLEIQPTNQEAVLLLADLNLRRQNPNEAITSLTLLLSQYPNMVPAQLLLASAYRARGNYQEAFEIYGRLSQRFPTNPQPALLTGALMQQQGRYEEALASYEKALSVAPDYFPALEQLVNLQVYRKQSDDAFSRLEEELSRQPERAQLYELRARVNWARTNYAAAETDLNKALSIASNSWSAQQLLAQVYVAQNKQNAALERLQEMVARNTNDVTSWLQIAGLHSASSNYQAAKEAYEQTLTVAPKYATALNNFAWLCLEHLNEPQQAYDLASRARSLQPTNSFEALFIADTLGWVLFKQGDYPRALALIQESARSQIGEEPEIQYHLGMTHYMLGEEAAAKVALQNALLLGRESTWRPQAEDALKVLELDPTATDEGVKHQMAALAEHRPEDPILQMRLGELAEREGDWKQAAANYEKALELNPNLGAAALKLAQLVETKLDNPARAMELAKRARELDPTDPEVALVLGRLAFTSARTAADFRWADSLLQEAARALGNEPEALFNAAISSYGLGQVATAVSLMEKVVTMHSSTNRAEAAQTFLEMVKAVGDDAAAANAAPHAEAILKQQPESVPALMVVGVVQEKRGDYGAARDTFEQVLKLRPLFLPANKRLAQIYYAHLTNPQKAYEHASTARERDPSDRHVALVLGKVSYERGDYSRAASLLAESALSYPNDAQLYFYLGMAQFNLKQSNESKQSLTKALALAPQSSFAEEARRVLAELN